MSNAHIAKNAKNQPLVDAMTTVLIFGPKLKTVGSCGNVQALLDRGFDGKHDCYEAFNSSEAYANSLGLREVVYPVEYRISLITRGDMYYYRTLPQWEGYVGAMRRQWLHEVREFVKASDTTFDGQ